LNEVFKTFPEDLDSLDKYFVDPSSGLDWNLVFTLPLWLRAWWDNFGAGGSLFIRSVIKNNQLIGLSPLQIRNGSASIIGSVNVCDYQDFILRPGFETEFYTAILEDLKQNGILNLHLETIRPDSTIVKYLMSLAKSRGCEIDYHQTDVSSDIQLPSGWNEYLKILDGKQRHELNRKMRNLGDIGVTQYRSVSRSDQIPGMIDVFLNLFPESRQDKAEFLTGEMKTFFKSLAISLSKHELVGFGILEFSDQPLAMTMFFDYNNNRYLYNSAYDPRYKSNSVGIISKALCIQESIQKGKRTFDFLKGSEKYKAYLGGREIPLYSCDITIR
jgi:CelD/BcsL family acetyltransferase involved in cellulose biosynthesis